MMTHDDSNRRMTNAINKK